QSSMTDKLLHAVLLTFGLVAGTSVLEQVPQAPLPEELAAQTATEPSSQLSESVTSPQMPEQPVRPQLTTALLPKLAEDSLQVQFDAAADQALRQSTQAWLEAWQAASLTITEAALQPLYRQAPKAVTIVNHLGNRLVVSHSFADYLQASTPLTYRLLQPSRGGASLKQGSEAHPNSLPLVGYVTDLQIEEDVAVVQVAWAESEHLSTQSAEPPATGRSRYHGTLIWQRTNVNRPGPYPYRWQIVQEYLILER
ncbi:MAG: hypothetical protein AAGF24_01595, partial [Cyanobacteria bacterium P01_H01_bin.121]